MEILSSLIGTTIGGGIVLFLAFRVFDALKDRVGKVEEESKEIVENYNIKFEKVYDKIDKTNEKIADFKNEVIETITRIETKMDFKIKN